MVKQVFGLTSILLLALSAQALSLSTDLEGANGYSSLHVQVSEIKTQEEPGFYFATWSVGAGGSQSKTEDSVTHETTVTRSRDFFAGLGFSYSKTWDFDLAVDSNSTPETNYSQSGGSLNIAYRNDLWALGVGSGSSHIKQKISFKILTVTINRDAELDQKMTSAFASVTPLEWLKLRLSGKVYSYSKSKADLQAAYANRFLNYRTSDLVNSIGGLPENSSELKCTFFIGKEWDMELLASNTHLIVDDSNSRTMEWVATHYFEHWSLGGGLSHQQSDQSKDTSLLVSTQFDF